ncbi:hypothetical protein BHE74_00054523 [Ensete ventricosum]|nr:hypothetical protein BHE74_00054523 [Ensete ventricosum]
MRRQLTSATMSPWLRRRPLYIELMSINLKEVDRYVVNHGEGLTTVDFSDHVSLAKKEGANMVGRGGLTWGRRSSIVPSPPMEIKAIVG